MNTHSIHRIILRIVLAPALMLATGTAAAQDPATEPATQPSFPRPGTYDREMTVSPASADGPTAAPRDALWPDSLTFTRDNAAPLYLAGMIQVPNFHDTDQRLYDIGDRLFDATPDNINVAEAEEYLGHFDRTMQTIAPTIHRPRVVWDWPWHEQGYLTLLPHLNQMRYIGNTLGFQAKLDLSRNNFPAALSRIRQNFVIGPHAGAHDEAVYVEGLVGVGLAAQATSSVMWVVERADSPNLHEALMSLPEPMFNPRTWVQMEHRMFRESVPMLYEPEMMDEARWVEVWRQFGWMGLTEKSWTYHELPPEEQTRIARELGESRREGMVAAAIAWMSERGGDAAALRTEAQANPYPVLARYMTGTMDEYMDEATALVQLPFAEAYPRLTALADDAEQIRWWRDSNPEDPNHDTLAPNFDRGLISLQRLRQRIAAAIALEALRDHAAEHGAWPDSLEDVRLYVPADPISCEPFEYRRDGDRFVLRASPDPRPNGGFEWRVTLRDE